jgi:antibiotic biosynthesis monooxygenase (ABM) superfamily enzyme
MNRRCYIQSMLAAAASAVSTRAAASPRHIQLHLDLAVDPKREQEMLDHFEKVFRPTARKQPGYIDLKMLKLQEAIRGGAPPGGKFRFVLTFVSEEMRQKWIATAAHAQVWPKIEDTLLDKNFNILVYDEY